MTGRKKGKERSFSNRWLREDEYKKQGGWQVGILHRASTSQKHPASAEDPMQPAVDAVEKAGQEWATELLKKVPPK